MESVVTCVPFLDQGQMGQMGLKLLHRNGMNVDPKSNSTASEQKANFRADAHRRLRRIT